MRRIIPPIWLLLASLIMAALHFIAPIYTIIPTPYTRSGLAIILVSLLLFAWSVSHFIRAKTTIRPLHESSALLTTGPFRITRNPIYLAMVLLLLGIAVLLGSATPFLVVVLFVLLIDRLFIAREEPMLRATFGNNYKDYCSRVRRWL